MRSQNLTGAGGFVLAADQGQPFWFLNTLTSTKVGSNHSHGQLSIVDHRGPPGFAPPPHLHHHSGEALFILDGQLDGFCGDHSWRAGPGSQVFMPRAIPHGFTVADAGPGRARSSSWPPRRLRPVRRGRRRAGPGPAPARTRPARPGPPHPARYRPRHPDPAPARTITTRRQAAANPPARRRAGSPGLRASAADRPDGPQRSEAVTGCPRNPDLRRSDDKRQRTSSYADRRGCARCP